MSKAYCFDCRRNVRGLLVEHHATASHRRTVERKGRPLRDLLPRRRPSYYISLNQYDQQYDEVPEGWTPSPEWAQA